VRVLIATNLYPSAEHPRRGRFVRDQVEELKELEVEVEVFSFPLGARSYLPATFALRRLLREQTFDVVHAHYGLCGWVARLAGARPLVITFHGTDVRHPLVGPGSRLLARRADLAAGASRSTFEREGGRLGLPLVEGRTAVLPCGVDLERFHPAPREEARERLGLDAAGRYLFFPADPSRRVKRHDRATEVARLAGAELLVAGEVHPEQMPDWVNAANAVLVTSESEGLGLAVLEALACGIPVLSTPVGVAPHAAAGVRGCLVTPFEAEPWAAFARQVLDAPPSRVDGRGAVSMFSARRMAERVRVAYEAVAAHRRPAQTAVHRAARP
jgi:glycosyltransferase involved in cell wall biosynthesis